ncbi:MAG: Sir2 family NAD-dependent protein deacetylase, partial [Dehalococcoidia bacterium]|nr:Sir2 family NAD-dependent protein deacetylase [Dehalococcoidia bacterium]
TGAGISTESGIPDFRGPDGVWTKDPEAERRAYRSYETFLVDPRAYWEERLSDTAPFSIIFREVEKARPNQGHLALAELEEMSILKGVITQNVDGLHCKAGSRNILEYHGCSFKLRCAACGTRFEREDYDLEEMKKRGELPPRCKRCGGVVKSDTVSFGEPIPSDVARQSREESLKCDLMLICGTSAVVYPFAELPRMVGQRRAGGVATVIEVNAEPTPLTQEGVSDYIIQGLTGEILPLIVGEVKRRMPE